MKKALVSALAMISVAAPTTVALAATDSNTQSSPAAGTTARGPTLAAAAVEHAYAQVKRARKRAKLAAKRRARKRALKRQAAQSSGAGSASPQLQAIAACESGGNPSAIGGGGQFRGKYQFDEATWQSVGGTGDPAAAPVAEQDMRAAMLLARSGSNPWPVCGK